MSGSRGAVVVIGGGAAGIAAARRLMAASVPCRIVEARPRLGGRAWSVPDRSGVNLDLGCGWLHSADRNPWREIAEAQGRAIDKTPPPWSRPASPLGFPMPEQHAFLDALQAFYARLEKGSGREPDGPASELLDPGDRHNPMLNAVSSYVNGIELDRVSRLDFARYHDTGVNWRVVDGYGTTIAAHAAGIPVVLDCPVRRIDHGGRRLRIETAQGTIEAAQAIVTLPSDVLAEQPELFAPALPEKTEAAAGLPLGLADKLFLGLDGAEEFEKETRLFGRTDTSATAFYHLRPFGRPMIEAYFAGTLARELEAGGDGAFFDFARSQLVARIGSAFAKRIAPVNLHRWASDPFARGSYSYAMPGKSGCRGMLAAPVDDRLFFAGEACSPHDFSTAHGAYATGVVAAEQAIAARARA